MASVYSPACATTSTGQFRTFSSLCKETLGPWTLSYLPIPPYSNPRYRAVLTLSLPVEVPILGMRRKYACCPVYLNPSLPFDICDDTHCSLGMLMCNCQFSSRGLSSLWVGASSIAQTWKIRYLQRSELIAIALDVSLLYSSREGHRVSLPIVQGILSTLFS